MKNSLGSPFPQPRQLRFFPLFAVTHQLLEGLVHGVGGELVGVLALDDDQGNAVHEQHDVGNDEVLDRARRVDAELVDGEEVVPLRVVEVDQLDIRVLLAGQFVDIDLRPVEELLDGFVGFDQAAGWAGEEFVVESSSCLSVSQRLTVLGAVDLAHAVKKMPLRMTSRKLVRRLFVGSVGTPGPWSMTSQSSEASWSRNGFSTKRYSDMDARP